MATQNAVPHFLGIGAKRSGTTWLHRQLNRHPEVYVTPIKELHFFDRDDHWLRKKTPRYRNHLPRRVRQNVACLSGRMFWKRYADSDLAFDPVFDLRYFTGPRTNDWYRGLFSHAAAKGKKTGEITINYASLSPDEVARVKEVNSDVRIIYIMRDPIDRTWSQATSVLCKEAGRTLDEVPPEEFHKLFDSTRVTLRASYMQTVETWENAFPREQILYGFFDDIAANPRAFLDSLSSFLAIDAAGFGEHADLDRPVNTSSKLVDDMPEWAARHLAAKYAPTFPPLIERFGEAPARWQKRAEEILAATAS